MSGGIALPTPWQDQVEGRTPAVSPASVPTLDTGARLSNLHSQHCPVKFLQRLELDLSLQRKANKSEIQRGPSSALPSAAGKDQAS